MLLVLFNQALENEENIRVKTAIMTFLLTGFRRGETARLEWGDFDLGFVQHINKNRFIMRRFYLSNGVPDAIRTHDLSLRSYISHNIITCISSNIFLRNLV